MDELIEQLKNEYRTLNRKEQNSLVPIHIKNKQLRTEIEQWIVALESGEYQQAQNTLYEKDEGYCCLGVACYISGFSNEDMDDYAIPRDMSKGHTNKLTEMLMNFNGGIHSDVFNSNLENLLTSINDDTDLGFEFIAKLLRAKYKIYE